MNYTCRVDETDYARFEPKKEALLKMARIEQLGISVLDLHTNQFLLYVSPNYTEWDDATLKQFEQENNIDFILRLLHPKDISYAKQAQAMCYNYLSKLPASTHSDYTLLLDLRVLHPKGYYYRVVHQSTVLEHDRNGTIWLLYCKLELIDKQVDYLPAKRYLIHTPTKKQQLFNGSDGDNSRFLTKQELEISRLVAKGFESQEIARMQFISTNTVRNHRQNILNKTATNSMSQAINYLQKLGLI